MRAPPPDQLEITAPTGEVRRWQLDVSRGITNLGRHASNDIVLTAATIQPFHFMLDHRQVPYHLIALHQTPVGQRMEPVADLHLDKPVVVAGHRFRLLPSTVVERRALPTPPAPLSLSAELSVREWSSEAGRTHTTHLILYNHSSREESCTLSAEGSAAPWLTLSPPEVTVPAGGRAVVVLCLTPPRQPTSVAGTHPLALLITPTERPDSPLRREVTVRVQPFYDFSVGPLFPAKQSLSFLRATGQATLPITNLSNTTASLRVEGVAVGGHCGFEFTAPDEAIPFAGAITLSLGPGESVSLPMTILPPPRPTFGTQRQGHHFTLTTTLLVERTPKRTVGGLLIAPPRVGPGLVSVFLVCLLLLALALPRLREPTPTALALAPNVDEQDSSLLDDFEEGKLDEWLATHAPVPPTPLPTLVPVPGQPDAPLGEGFAGPMTYEAMFKKIAAEYNLDWRVLAGVAYRESRINPQALGQDYDMGLMQILPSTWDQIAPPLGVSDPYDPYSNALAGAAFLAYLRDYLWEQGYSDERLMLVSYNWGPGNVRRALEGGGGWSAIPVARQKYALDVLRFARSYPPPGMEDRLDQLVEGFPME